MERKMEAPSTRCCNACGRILKQKNGILVEDVFEGRKEWGYFSDKDLELHEFLLCEVCYDEMIAGFAIPVAKIPKKEVL